MRHRHSASLAFLALGAGLAFGGGSALAAPTDPLPEQPLIAAPQGNWLWTRWEASFHAGAATLWPDATLRSFYDRVNPSAPSGPGIFSTLDSNGSGALPVLDPDDTQPDYNAGPTPGSGSLTGLRADTAPHRLWGPAVIGVDGRNWNIQDEMESERGALYSSDEHLNSKRATRTVEGQLVPTSAGLRIVSAGPAPLSATAKARLRGKKKPRGTRIFDAHRHLLAYLPGLTPATAAAGRDGALVVVGSREKLSFGDPPSRKLLVARVTGSGRVTTHRLHGLPKRLGSLDRRWYPALLQSARGPLLVLRPATRDDRATVFGMLTPSGAITRATSLATAGVPGLVDCRKKDGYTSIENLSIGADGLPLVGVHCATGGPPAPGDFLFSLNARLRFGQMVSSGAGERFQSWTTGTLPDGRLGISFGDDSISAVAQPGALAPARGQVTRVRANGARSALVRIECRRPFGAVCSGVVQLTDAGAFLGWAPYALPGRPGRARTVFDLTVPLWPKSASGGPLPNNGVLPSGAKAALSPLPTRFDRDGPTPPPNPGPPNA